MTFTIDTLRSDLEAHGELHAKHEELDAELELRRGQATIEDDGRIVVTTHGETHVYDVERIAYYYLPEEIHH